MPRFEHRTPTGKLKRHFYKGPDFNYEAEEHIDNPGLIHWHLWYILYDYLKKPKLLLQVSVELEQIVAAWINSLKKDSLYPKYGFTLHLLGGDDLIISVGKGTDRYFPYSTYAPTPTSRPVQQEVHFVQSIPELLEGTRSEYPKEMLPYFSKHKKYWDDNFERRCLRSKGDLKKLAEAYSISLINLKKIIVHGNYQPIIDPIRKMNGLPPLVYDHFPKLLLFAMVIEISSQYPGPKIITNPRINPNPGSCSM